MNVVCNATPLISLAGLGRLGLLRELFGQIHISDGVYEEVVVRGKGRPGETEVTGAPWILRHTVADTGPLAARSVAIGRGEIECLTLARQLPADLLVLDDRLARLHAQTPGIRITGTTGILLMAGERKLVDFEPAFSQLLASGFRLSPRETERILDLWRGKSQR
jgi:predicted nucleic acid-binding protein